MVDTYIYLTGLALGALVGRELWLHIQIAKMQRDISWIVRWINGDNPRKEE